ncbi:putative FAD-linked oxidoreductase [Fundidesulfovibrio magnetotacticus]|uniref:Putative FAD-linked oxidoreductase n=1 Tax=Fundidesulfovibrio magnetotacticus TaxID=2730080 RepID=A0A6V8LSU5_9BACT|nr:FAD-binding and (Fe-S)-binding domain-containing protein [Fundidesulfovibrio magnetotacticus]GFK94030.1 putative FAD-linked oxidoreductase [Fundidesulfovibrio magnetotacticus]
MPEKNPHISIPAERLVPRLLGISEAELKGWPEDVQETAVALASELFLVRYNPFIDASDARESVEKRLAQSATMLTPEYFSQLTRAVRAFWEGFDKDTAFRAELKAKVSEFLDDKAILDGPHNLVECSTDATDLRMELPLMVLAPERTEDVQRIVRLAGEMGFSLIPRGGASGCTGGAVPARRRTVVLSLTRLKRILSADPETMTLCVQAGVITLQAIRAASEKGMLFTVDPASKAASSIGGNISENAGGPYAFEYGTTLDNLLSYKMVMPSGQLIEVVRENHPRHKILPHEKAVFHILNEAGKRIDAVELDGGEIRGPGLGKDVSNKYLGGLPGMQKEGVDGVITEACFICHDKLKYSKVIVLEFFGRSMHNAMLAIQAVVAMRDRIRQDGDLVKISALEEFNAKYVRAIEYQKKSKLYEGDPISVLVLQLDGNDLEALDREVAEVVTIAQRHDGVDAFVARDDKEAELFWEDRHKLSAIAKRTSGFKINEDVVIPMEVIPEFSDFLEQLNLTCLARAYRKALQEVTRLPGFPDSDGFVSMEMQFAAEILRGVRTTAELNDQELEVQAYYFFTDLKTRYPKLYGEIEAIHADMLARRVEVASHMHAGDGNCHVNLPVNSNDPEMLAQAHEAADKVFAKVMELGGAVSGEHGIGITKIAFLPEDKITALKAYKEQVDPGNIFNPGKLVTRQLDCDPYTFSFNRLIKDIRKTALPDKDKLIKLLTDIQVCTRCGKCKQVCPMYQPERGLIYHPRNKNISLGSIIEAIYYSQVHHGRPSAKLLESLRKMTERCTTCGKCTAACPVKIKTAGAMLDMRAFIEEKGAGGHPVKSKVLHFVAEKPEERAPAAAKAAAWGQALGNRVVGLLPGPWRSRFASPMLHGSGPVTGFKNLADALDLSKGGIFIPERPSGEAVFYFPGCGAALFWRQIGLAAIHLMLRAGVSVVIPERHMCCGYPLLSSGFQDAYRKNRARNIETLGEIFVKAANEGVKPQAVLTACGTCRESLDGYETEVIAGSRIPHYDVAQYLMERLPARDERARPLDVRLVYHAACHAEWAGVPLAKAPELYRQALGELTGSRVDLSPGCCGESGLGAITSPDLFNRIRLRKQEQLHKDLGDAKSETQPILVGCPSCKIGVKRCLLRMGRKQHVLHVLEYLVQAQEGPKWRKGFLKALAKARQEGRKRVVAYPGGAARG